MVHNHDNIDETMLFMQIRDGDSKAMTVVYEKYHRMLYVLAFRYLKDSDKAQDAVQNAFAKLWEFRTKFTVTANLKNYLYTMTKNYVLNQIRNENKAIAENYKIAQYTGEHTDNLFDVIEKNNLMEIFSQAIEKLPQQKRMVCLYKMDENLSAQEIAEKMNLSVNTVKTHYAQSKKMLRSFMEKMIIVLISITLFRF